MGRSLSIFFICLFCSMQTRAQLLETFSDGEFLQNPVWSGNTASWTVNTGGRLQSMHAITNSSFYLSTAVNFPMAAQWDFYCQLDFNPSGANYTDVFLTSSLADLSLPNTTGYFVRVGNTDDEVALYRKDVNGVVKIIDGQNGLLNNSHNELSIRVTSNANAQWQLMRDVNTGVNFISEGTAADATYINQGFFGMLVKQSTSGFFQRHFFDDIHVQPFVPDIVPPTIRELTVLDDHHADLLFSEAVTVTSSQLSANYFVSDGIGFPMSAVRDAGNSSLVHLGFASAFPPRKYLTLETSAISDLSGNILQQHRDSLVFFIPKQFDILITEIMADPEPPVGLPAVEWIELKNNSGFDINIKDWRVAKRNSSSTNFPSLILKKDSLLILGSTSAATLLQPFGRTLGITGFPALSNNGDTIFLQSPDSSYIHSIPYTDAWYGNALKRSGGWSLEMMDEQSPCIGISNWKASNDSRGGSPAKLNSIKQENRDLGSPKLLRAWAPDSLHILLTFDEPVSPEKAISASNYQVDNGIGTAVAAKAIAPMFTTVVLVLAQPLLHHTIYTVTVNAVCDCAGNNIANDHISRVGLAEPAGKNDLIINEILFDPRPGEEDYVEIYNRGKEIVNLRTTFIAGRDAAMAIATIHPFSLTDVLLFPGEFAVISPDTASLRRGYLVKNPGALQETDLPAMNNDKGHILILNQAGEILDELNYDARWHFALINNPEGIALERINYAGITQDESNWHSAASDAGYGTPTSKNSQAQEDDFGKGAISVQPEIVSPDNDGLDDFATIRYNFPSPGYVVNITIYDAAGRLIRKLQENALAGLSGFYRWDGLDAKGQQLPVGIYLVYTEAFNLQGKVKRFKNAIVLARRP